MGIYENIKEICEEKGISINRLERELNFPRSSIAKYNASSPSADKIQKIADFLEVTTDKIIKGGKEGSGINCSVNEFEAKTKEEKELLVLCRKTSDMPDEYKDKMFNTIKDTIDIYLKAINKEDKPWLLTLKNAMH